MKRAPAERIPVRGVVLSDQIRNLDWRSRRAELIARAPSTVIETALAKLHAILGDGPA